MGSRLRCCCITCLSLLQLPPGGSTVSLADMYSKMKAADHQQHPHSQLMQQQQPSSITDCMMRAASAGDKDVVGVSGGVAAPPLLPSHLPQQQSLQIFPWMAESRSRHRQQQPQSPVGSYAQEGRSILYKLFYRKN